MKSVCVLFVLFFALDLAGKCDTYINGAIYIHKNQATDEEWDYYGCRKGCFYNGTVTEDGAKKCEKCSNIEDEELCRSHTRTCHWTKGGKCGSAYCSQIGKVYDREINSLEIKRCIDGTDEDQYYNNLFVNEVIIKGIVDINLPWGLTGSYSNCGPFRKWCENNVSKTYDSKYQEFFSKPAEYWVYQYRKSAIEAANAWREGELEQCRKIYEGCVSDCNMKEGVAMLAKNHAEMVAARKSCHVISGCMYSKSNNRCSVWAVWAFVLVLVILILVALVAVGVACFLVLSQLKNDGGGRGRPAKVSDGGGVGGGGEEEEGQHAEASNVGSGDERKPEEVSDVSS